MYLSPSLQLTSHVGEPSTDGQNQPGKQGSSKQDIVPAEGQGWWWEGAGMEEMLQTTGCCSCLREHLVPVWTEDT